MIPLRGLNKLAQTLDSQPRLRRFGRRREHYDRCAKVPKIWALRWFLEPTRLKDVPRQKAKLTAVGLLQWVLVWQERGWIDSPGHGPEWRLTPKGLRRLKRYKAKMRSKCGSVA